MAKEPVLILGAGFSKAAGGPLLGELLHDDFIGRSQADPAFLRDASTLYTLRNNTGTFRGPPPSYTIEDLFTEVWHQAGIGGEWGLQQKWDARIALRELQIHLASVTGGIKLRRGTNRWNTYVSYLAQLAETAKRVYILSFNYDLLVEQCLRDLEVRYDYGKARNLILPSGERAGQLRSESNVTILKLHGSSNWGSCRACAAYDGETVVTVLDDAYVPAPRRRRCPACENVMLEPGIVPPITAKSSETRAYADIWREAREAIAKTKDLTVIGYSMPSGDAGARELLPTGLDARHKHVRVVCGPRAPETYDTVFGARYVDAHSYFEEYAEGILATR